MGTYRWLLTVLALDTLFFFLFFSFLSLSIWDSFEPLWVSQLPLIFLYKCGKHDPLLLSSVWLCTPQNDSRMNLQAARWYFDKGSSPVGEKKKIGIESKPEFRCVVWFSFFPPLSLSKRLALCDEWMNVCMSSLFSSQSDWNRPFKLAEMCRQLRL